MPTHITRTGNNFPNGNFIPEWWSAKLNDKYYNSTCLHQITNNKYEGEIKNQGSTVQIRVRPTIQVSKYIPGEKIQTQDISDEKIELRINQAVKFAFAVDDIDATQSNIPLFNELTKDASEQMKIYIDTQVLGSVYADASLSLATAALDSTTVLNWIIQAGVKLSKNAIPTTGRWLVIPPDVGGLIQNSDLKNVSLSGDNGTSIMRSDMENGKLGRIAGFDIYISNNLAVTAGGTFQCIAGHKSAVTFASQIAKVRNIELPDAFSRSIQGLNVYGFKTLIPTGLVSMPATV